MLNLGSMRYVSYKYSYEFQIYYRLHIRFAAKAEAAAFGMKISPILPDNYQINGINLYFTFFL